MKSPDLLTQIKLAGLPEPVPEHPFAKPERRFRFDFAWLDQKVALEHDGGVHSGGRHVRGYGVESDSEKFSLAAALGWRVLRCTPRMVKDGSALGYLKRALAYSKE